MNWCILCEAFFIWSVLDISGIHKQRQVAHVETNRGRALRLRKSESSTTSLQTSCGNPGEATLDYNLKTGTETRTSQNLLASQPSQNVEFQVQWKPISMQSSLEQQRRHTCSGLHICVPPTHLHGFTAHLHYTHSMEQHILLALLRRFIRMCEGFLFFFPFRFPFLFTLGTARLRVPS